MTDRYAHKDVYTYDDSPVLRNKAGHTSQEALDRFERLSVANRMLDNPPSGNFDYQHLKALHFHLFQDVYEWAGEERNVSISKDATTFANPRFIHGVVSELLQKLAGENRLCSTEPGIFAERAAHYVLELNLAHPFREGNGRTIRYFLSLLADNAGYGIDDETLAQGWLAACVEGVSRSDRPMRDLIARALVIYEE